MGLHQNGFRDNIGVFRYAGLTASNGAIPSALPINTACTGAMRNLTAGEGITDDKVGLPVGYLEGGSWLLPQKPGLLSSYLNARLSVTATATGVLGLPGSGSASFAVTTNNPVGGLIVSGSGSASLAVTTNNPILSASVNGAGSASLSVTPNTPILGAIAGLSGSASLAINTNSPVMYPLDDSSPLRTGSASFSFSATLEPYAVGHMTGTALPYTELSPQSLASAVWDSILADFQRDGSAGKALSTASSGGVDLGLMSDAVWEHAEAEQVSDFLGIVMRIMRNKTVTNPVNGTMTVFSDDGVTPLYVAPLYEDVAGAQPYRGQGADRRERLE